MGSLFSLLAARSRFPIVVGSGGLVLIGFIFTAFYAGMRPDKNLAHILKQIPRMFLIFLGGQHVNLFSAEGFLAMNFKHPLALLAFCSVAVTVGSRAPAGEVGSGMMDVLLSHSIRRRRLIAALAVVLWGAAACVVVSLYAGHLVGVNVLDVPIENYETRMLPVVLHGWLFVGFIGMMTLAISAFCRSRGRAVGVAIAFIALFLLADLGANMWREINWVKWGNPFGYYEPTKVVATGAIQWWDLVALAVGAALLAGLAVWQFNRRQIP